MLLNLKNISKAYGNQEEPTYQVVLKDLSLSVEEGESIAILGPSGSGKSTLLNIIGTLDYPDEGTLEFRGRDISGLRGRDLDYFRNMEIGFVFQFHHLLPQCNVLENVLIPTLVASQDRKSSEEYAGHLLQMVGLWEHRHKKPGHLSGGECQRVAVVRAMINHPSLILADEPTGALDGKNVSAIAELLKQLKSDENLTLITVTHSRFLASAMGTTYELEGGKLTKK